ncbi:hypothetical protein Syun_026134 [Stephania yunnanensis]|uniref:Uncharacterized protein n=1 Tax=Stephania yunnanensis TaxID=152371 RepID=A0AAP0HW10_9MAGN
METVARDRVRDPVEYTDRDSDLVVHMGKEMDMFQLERDFNVSAWAYGQPGDRDGAFFGWRSRRSPACRVTEEPRWLGLAYTTEEP